MLKSVTCLLLINTLSQPVFADEREDKIILYISNYNGDYSGQNIERIQADAKAHGVSASEIESAMKHVANSSASGKAGSPAAEAENTPEVVSGKIQKYMNNYNGDYSAENVQRIQADAAAHKITPAQIDAAMGFPAGTTEKEFSKIKNRDSISAEAVEEDRLIAEAQKVFGQQNGGLNAAYANGLGGYQPVGSKYYGDNPMPYEFAKKLPELSKNNQDVINAALNIAIERAIGNGIKPEDSTVVQWMRGFAEDPSRRGQALTTAASILGTAGVKDVAVTADYGFMAVLADVSKLNTNPPKFEKAYDPQWDRPSMYDMINSTFGWTEQSANYGDPKNRTPELNRKLTDDEIRAFQNGTLDAATLAQVEKWRGGAVSPSTVISSSSNAAPIIKSDFANCSFNLTEDAKMMGVSVASSSETKSAEASLASTCRANKTASASGVIPSILLTEWSSQMGKVTGQVANVFADKVSLLLSMPDSTSRSNPVARAMIAKTYSQTIDAVNSSLRFYKLSDKYEEYSNKLQKSLTKDKAVVTAQIPITSTKSKKEFRQKFEQGLVKNIILSQLPGQKPRIYVPDFNPMISENTNSNSSGVSEKSIVASKESNRFKSDADLSSSSFSKDNNSALNSGLNNAASVASTDNGKLQVMQNGKSFASLAGLPPKQAALGNKNFKNFNIKYATAGEGRSIASISEDSSDVTTEASIDFQNDIRNYVILSRADIGYKYRLQPLSQDSLFEKVTKAYIRNYDRLVEIP